jgi:hypothetical protein
LFLYFQINDSFDLCAFHGVFVPIALYLIVIVFVELVIVKNALDLLIYIPDAIKQEALYVCALRLASKASLVLFVLDKQSLSHVAVVLARIVSSSLVHS